MIRKMKQTIILLFVENIEINFNHILCFAVDVVKNYRCKIIYNKGESIIYDYYVDSEDYRWISWVGTSCKRRYMVVRE